LTIKANALLLTSFAGNFPTTIFLSEEAGELAQNSSYKWIIDPIDGTINYAHGIPVCCVSIALEINGQNEMAAVYNPFMHELFFAERGCGATLNGKLHKRKQ